MKNYLKKCLVLGKKAFIPCLISIIYFLLVGFLFSFGFKVAIPYFSFWGNILYFLIAIIILIIGAIMVVAAFPE